jgi:hypothetical protein
MLASLLLEYLGAAASTPKPSKALGLEACLNPSDLQFLLEAWKEIGWMIRRAGKLEIWRTEG